MAALARTFERARIPHAFGGAIALAYYATPRGTRDVDVNLFVPSSAFDRVLATLLPLGVTAPTEPMRRALERDDQVRIFWEGTPLDLFFSYAPLHGECMKRCRRVVFGAESLRVLSPEDLAVFKVLFARDKDWRDLREVLFAEGERFDAEYALSWLSQILEDADPRLQRFRALVAERSPE